MLHKVCTLKRRHALVDRGRQLWISSRAASQQQFNAWRATLIRMHPSGYNLAQHIIPHLLMESRMAIRVARDAEEAELAKAASMCELIATLSETWRIGRWRKVSWASHSGSE